MMDTTLKQIRDLVAELKTDVSGIAEVRIHNNILELDNLLGQLECESKAEIPSTDKICATLMPTLKTYRQMFKTRLNQNGLIELLLEGAEACVNIGELNDAKALYEEIATLAEDSQNITAKIEAIKQIGHLNSHQEQWQQAQEYYQQVIELCEDTNNKEEMANIYNNLGYNATLQGDFSQAKEYHQKASQIAEESDSRLVIADAHNGLGTIATVQADWDEAIEHFQQSITLYDELNDRRGMAQTYHNLAMAYAVDCEQWEEAGECYQIVRFMACFKFPQKLVDIPPYQRGAGGLWKGGKGSKGRKGGKAILPFLPFLPFHPPKCKLFFETCLLYEN